MRESSAGLEQRMRRVIGPGEMRRELGVSEEVRDFIEEGREEIRRVVRGEDRRKLVVVGPCSIDDIGAGMEYGKRIVGLQEEVKGRLLLVMRSYLEKPRTLMGWGGMVQDPYFDGSYEVEDGIRMGRGFLLGLLKMGVRTGMELMDPIVARYMEDVLCWGAVGSRTVDSPVHRQMVSGMGIPVGMKNSPDGRIESGVNAVYVSGQGGVRMTVGEEGDVVMERTKGNRDCHMVLRGGYYGPNYGKEGVEEARRLLRGLGLSGEVMVDCGHGNSGKERGRQGEVMREVIGRVEGGEEGIMGVMLESYLYGGKQEVLIGEGKVVGRSVTDECLSWEETEELIREFFRVVRV